MPCKCSYNYRCYACRERDMLIRHQARLQKEGSLRGRFVHGLLAGAAVALIVIVLLATTHWK